MPFERVPVEDKRQALKDWVQNILSNDFGEEFIYHQVAKTQMLRMNSRLQLLELAQNSNDKIRHCEVFWDGPEVEGEGNITGLFRNDNSELGSVEGFKVVIDYGVEYDSDGQINNRKTFESLFTSHSPKGLLVASREKTALDVDVNGTTRTVLLSTPINPVFPPTPRPMHSGSEQYAHYAEFRLLLTDM